MLAAPKINPPPPSLFLNIVGWAREYSLSSGLLNRPYKRKCFLTVTCGTVTDRILIFGTVHWYRPYMCLVLMLIVRWEFELTVQRCPITRSSVETFIRGHVKPTIYGKDFLKGPCQANHIWQVKLIELWGQEGNVLPMNIRPPYKGYVHSRKLDSGIGGNFIDWIRRMFSVIWG